MILSLEEDNIKVTIKNLQYAILCRCRRTVTKVCVDTNDRLTEEEKVDAIKFQHRIFILTQRKNDQFYQQFQNELFVFNDLIF